MASLFASAPIRTRLARRVFDEAFVCRRCIHNHQQRPAQKPSTSTTRALRDTPFLRAFRKPGHYQMRMQRASSNQSAPAAAASSPLGALGSTIGKAPPRPTPNKSSSSWPETNSKSVAYWLLGSAASVFGIVVFGGLTRLTESGLSITEWKPVTGSFPPRDEAAWEEEFALYKLSPEFIMLNSRMNLEEFKQIYWMEWGHRLWGRVVGITILLPTIYFVARKRVTPNMALRLTGICALIGFQGFIGWWMVKSGLKDDLLETGQQPRVSQYRLAAHLGTAFIAYLCMLSNGLQILRENRLVANPLEGAKLLETLQSPPLRQFRRLVTGLTALVFITAMSGALVAGLDAGLIYNDFPWMGQGLLPPKREMLDPFYSHTPDQGDLIWRNMLENPVLVQLDHRVLATTTFTAIIALWALTRLRQPLREAMPRAARVGMLGVVHLVSLQVVLGISTLWYLVPTPLAAAHQAGALALLSGMFLLRSRISTPKRTVQLVRKALEQTTAQSVLGKRGPDAMLKARMQSTVS